MASWHVKEQVINCATSPGLWNPISRPGTPTGGAAGRAKRCMFKTEELIARPLTPTGMGRQQQHGHDWHDYWQQQQQHHYHHEQPQQHFMVTSSPRAEEDHRLGTSYFGMGATATAATGDGSRANLDATMTSDLDRMLLKAAADGSAAHIQTLIHLGAHPECRDEAGFTPLHYACLGGHVDAVRVLLAKQEVSVDPKCREERTPQCVATEGGHFDVVEMLLRCRRKREEEERQQMDGTKEGTG